MTEQEWLECTDPEKMLAFLRGKASERKLRLLACACCRRIWHLLTDERSRKAVEVAERFADGLASETERATAECDAFNLDHYLIEMDEFYHGSHWFRDAAMFAAVAAASETLCIDAVSSAISTARRTLEIIAAEREWNPTVQGRVFRDLFPSPFRPVTLDPACRTQAVVQLARSLYEERRFEDMPVLADALEEAGCQDAVILEHCRGPGPHVRGCWVLDLVLGKE